MDKFLETFISGLSTGSIYALIALGYTMVYGIAKMLNFAHGDVIMIGAYATATAAGTAIFGSPVLSIFLSIVVCAALGFLMEKIAYKPLRDASPLAVLITAIGVSYFLQSLALIIFGSSPKMFPPLFDFGKIQITDGYALTTPRIITLAVTVIVMISMTLFVKKTKTGRAMLAVAEDKGAAQLMGINVNRIISITFIIGSSLASVAGICYGMSTTAGINPYTGAMPGIKAFTAAVVGGIGSIPGAMLGGVLIGLVEQFAKAYISTALCDAIVFGILIIVLLVKPTGLLGKKRSEKV